MNKKIRNTLLSLLSVATLGAIAVGCETGSEGSATTEYDYNFNQPYRAETDSFMTIDGKLEEDIWDGQNYLYWVGGKGNEIKATTIFTSKGLYIGVRAEDKALKWENRYHFANASRFRIQIVQEDEINYNDSRANIHPTRQFWFDIDAMNVLSRMERKFDGASYYEGELNGETEYMSAELFMPWSEMGYKEEELNAAGTPNAVKLLIQYWTPSTGYGGFPGFTDDDRFDSYYTYDANGSTCYVDRYSNTDTVGYSVGGWTPGDKWIVDEENKTAETTVDRTQILWFRKDANGVADSGGTHYIANVKVKAVKKAGMYPHVGLMTLSSKTIFSIYGVGTDGLANGTVSVSAARATDGGQWVATKNFAQTYATKYQGLPSGSDKLPEGMTLAADEVYLSVAKRGEELYYFVNGEYIGTEYDERLAGECVIGLFANGVTQVSDWSFVDYSSKTEELDDFLRNYIHFLTSKDNNAGYVVLDRLVVKHGEEVKIKVTPKPGYILTSLKFTETNETAVETDYYNEFVENANDATYTYKPEGDLHVSAIFERLPKDAVESIYFYLYDNESKNQTALSGGTYIIRGSDNRFIYSGSANAQGYVVGSLLRAGTHQLTNGETITVDGHYTIEISCPDYVTETFEFDMPANFDELYPDDPTTKEDENELALRFGLVSYPYGSVIVNGTTQASVGYKFDYEDGVKDAVIKEFTSPVSAKGNTKQYLKGGIYNGNYLLDGSVELLNDAKYSDPTNVWTAGAVVGFVLSAGSCYLEFKTAAWESGNLCLNYNGGTEISLNNFSAKLNGEISGFTKKGASWDITIARYNNVIYVYNADGVLGFTLSKSGLELVNSTIKSGAAKLDALNEGLKKFFDAGTQNAIGMYRSQNTEGGADYKHNLKYTDDIAALGEQFKAVNVTLKQGVNYTMTSESKYEVVGGYLKDTNVTVNFANIPASQKNYILVVEFADETVKMFGKYDKATGTFTATFPLNDDAIVYLEEYAFGQVMVNGTETKLDDRYTSLMLTDNGDGSYGNKFDQTGSYRQFFTNGVYGGNFLIDFTIEVADKDPEQGTGDYAYEIGSGVGATLSTGGKNQLDFFTNKWEPDKLLIYWAGAGIKINGFPRDNNLTKVGNQLNFKIMHYDGVLFFYNCYNELIFHVTDMGIVIDSPTSTWSGTPVAYDNVRQTFESMLKAGGEFALGVYREFNRKGAYNFSYTVDTSDDFIDDYTVTLEKKSTENYQMNVINALMVGNSYQTGSVTLEFTNVPNPTIASNYVMAIDYGNGKFEYVTGTYDKTNQKYIVKFSLKDNAVVSLEEYDFGAVSVNGATAGSVEVTDKLTLQSDGSYFNDWTNNKSNTQFYTNAVANGDYYTEVTITTIETNHGKNATNVWHCGQGFGITISAGGNNWIRLFGNAWEGAMFIQTYTGQAIRVTGAFSLPGNMLQADNQFKFVVMRLSNVIYIYNNVGNLVFHMDANGVTIDNSSCQFKNTGANNAAYDAVTADIVKFFNAGTENVIGLTLLNGPANAYGRYNWDLDFTAGTEYATSQKELFDNLPVTASSATVNGATITGAANAATMNPLTKFYTSNTSKALGFVPKADGSAMVTTGDYIVTLKIGSDTGSTDFRIYSSATNFVTIRTGVNSLSDYSDNHCNKVIFFDANNKWNSETRVGYNTNAYVNLDGDGGYTTFKIVRNNNKIYIYACDYMNGTTPAKYSNWKLIFSFGEGIDTTVPSGLTMKNASFGTVTKADSWFTQYATQVAQATNNVFGLFNFDGTAGQWQVEIDDTDANAAAFVANPPAVN